MTTPWKKLWFRAIGTTMLGNLQLFEIYHDGSSKFAQPAKINRIAANPLVQIEEQTLEELRRAFHLEKVEKSLEPKTGVPLSSPKLPKV